MQDWYTKSFGEDYLIVYRHRDFKGAYEEVRTMVEWLGLDRGASILDLCCGTGRHSLALTDFGYRVTGMDLSNVLLDQAKQADVRKQVRWVHGDMRDVPLDGPYDAVVNLFTSFGYFEQDEQNEKVIAEIGRLLSEQGRFIIDFLNPEYVITHLVPSSERSVDGLQIEEKRVIRDGCVQKTIRIREPDKPERTYVERVKLYRLPAFHEMTKRHGLVIDHVYGDYERGRYSESDSPRMIIVGTKRGSRR